MMTVLLIAAALILSVILAECACRLWFRYGADIYIWPPYYHVEMDIDPAILPQLTKHARFQANSLGARGEEPPPRGGKTFRILTTGGSAVECFALDQTEAWPHLVQEFLNRPENLESLGAERVYLSNIAKSNLTTDALCYSFPRLLPRFAPLDVLTIMIGTSAVNYWTGVGTPSELPAPDSPWWYIQWHSEHHWSWKPKGTAAAEVVRRWLLRLRKPTLVRTGVGGRFAKARQMRKTAREIRETFGSPAQWLRHYESSLAQAVAVAKQYARLVVLIRQPWFDKAEPTLEEEAQLWHGAVGNPLNEVCDVFYSHRVICQLMKLVDEATVRVGDRTGTPVLKPAEVVEASAQMFYDHFHLTTLGARVMGDYMGRQLLELANRSRGGNEDESDGLIRRRGRPRSSSDANAGLVGGTSSLGDL
jgi:hypothetical protein